MQKLSISILVAVVCFGFTSMVQQAFGQQMEFESSTILTVANGPVSLTVADFNSDGNEDIVTANLNSHNVAVFIGRGNRQWDDAVYYNTGQATQCVAVADVNLDGHLDIVAGDGQSSGISVLLGNGDGTFAPATAFGDGIHSLSLAIRDVNNDGIPDLLVGSATGLAVLMGNGDGSFRSPSYFHVGGAWYSLAAADFNRDGNIDVAAVNFDHDSVDVLLGLGDGTFSADVYYATGKGPATIAIGDANGDAVPDLFTANKTGNSISVLLGNGDGTFAGAVSRTVTNGPSALALGDLNGDGVLDVATVNGASRDVSILFGNGDGTFMPQKKYEGGGGASSMAMRDLDNDGRSDIVIPNQLPNTISLLFGKANGDFYASQDFTTGKGPYSVATADLNLDGKPDIVTANSSAWTISIMLGSGNGKFQARTDIDAGSNPRCVAVGDFNLDGKPDLAVSLQGVNSVAVYLGNGDGTVQTPTLYACGTEPIYLVIADFNGDGKPDVLTTNIVSNNVSVLLGKGDGTLLPAHNYAVGAYPLSAAVGDFNGDGKPDIVTANSHDGTLSVLIGNGDGTFKPQHVEQSYSPVSVDVGDMNGDGNLDIVTAEYQDPYGGTAIHLGNGDGTFQPFRGYGTDRSQLWSAKVCDFNSDGVADVALISREGFVNIFVGPGDGTMVGYYEYYSGLGGYLMAVSDLDGDMKPDIVTANNTNSNVSVLLNKTYFAPRLVLNKTKFNLGDIQAGAPLVDSIVATNPGEAPLSISSVTSDNPSVVIVPDQATVPPRSQFTFRFSVTSPGFGPLVDHLIFNHDGLDSPDTVTITARAVTFVSMTIIQDHDADLLTTSDQTPKEWRISLFRNQVADSTRVIWTNASSLTAKLTRVGTYIAYEADSGASWKRLDGNRTRFDTLMVTTAAINDTFINYHQNRLVLTSYRDNDGRLSSPGDRIPKPWHVEVHKNSGQGPTLVSSESDSLSLNDLPDGSYVALQADSAGWLRLGYTVNLNGMGPVTTQSTADSIQISFYDGQFKSVAFVCAPPIYGRLFRTITVDSLVVDRDNLGKSGRLVKRKADKCDFKFRLKSPRATNPNMSLSLKFSMMTQGMVTRDVEGSDTIMRWNGQTAIFTPPVIDTSEWIYIEGRGDKGKEIKVSYKWMILPRSVDGKVPDSSFYWNQPGYPMPNRINLVAETFSRGGVAATGGLQIGIERNDSAKTYGWLSAPKYTDVLKSLIDKGAIQSAAPKNFDVFTSGRPIHGQQKNLSPLKYNNRLLAQLIVAKLNIFASALGILPVGFGELIFDDGTNNPLNGRMVREIVQIGDSMMSARSYKALFESAATYESRYGYINLDTTISRINNAFEGARDTISFAGVLEFRGAKELEDVPYLHANPATPVTILNSVSNWVGEQPADYELFQNYPNPFNPTTTIAFQLPEEAFVTVKVYNILGAEVATLYDHALLDEGMNELVFNASGLSSGVYFVRLIAQSSGEFDDGSVSEKHVFVKKIALIK